jgi:hypothetical protein
VSNLTGYSAEQVPLNSTLNTMAWQDADAYLKLNTVAVSGNITAAHNTIYLVSTAATRTITLPAAKANFCFWVKDSTNQAATNNITIARASSESIDGVAANKTLSTNGGSWLVVCDGTNWFTL